MVSRKRQLCPLTFAHVGVDRSKGLAPISVRFILSYPDAHSQARVDRPALVMKEGLAGPRGWGCREDHLARLPRLRDAP